MCSLSGGGMNDLVNGGSDKPVRTFYKGRTCGGVPRTCEVEVTGIHTV